MFSPGSLLQLDWYRSQEGREVFSHFMQNNGLRRKTFGLLERPNIPSLEEFTYKLFLVGKTGVGKTSTAAKLSGNDVPSVHCETSGIQTSTIYWPARILQLNKTVLFNIQLWDAGENALRKFDHVLPACVDKVDGILLLFSFVDKGSFEEIPQFITRLTDPDDGVCKVVIGTKFDQHAHSEITQRDIRDFESTWKIPILKIKNVPEYHHTDSRNDLSDVLPILNSICEHLWYRDVLLAGRSQNKGHMDHRIAYC
ncbi:ciliogenesis and planar polarity effector 2-like [Haliotis cracherodii]|uniref:ciliogenesis and planar polarity effector 2-like n=1 Tax=Haliotis cracherodii TaxID=6455 RepID=UPI0039EC51D6